MLSTDKLIFIDFHTHWDWDAPLAVPENVWRIVSTPLEHQARPIGTNVLQTLELHPWQGEAWSREFAQSAALPRFAGIGEVGLDRLRGKRPLNEQIQILIRAYELAGELQKPLIIHCVKCFSELLALHKQLHWQLPSVIHYFRGGLPLARQLWDHTDFILSLPPAALVQDELWDFLQKNRAYQQRIVLETDDPHHGDIQKHYQLAAEKLNVSVESLQQLMQEQLRRLYNV